MLLRLELLGNIIELDVSVCVCLCLFCSHSTLAADCQRNSNIWKICKTLKICEIIVVLSSNLYLYLMIPIEFSLFSLHFLYAVFLEYENHIDLAKDKKDIYELMFKILLTISMFLPLG